MAIDYAKTKKILRLVFSFTMIGLVGLSGLIGIALILSLISYSNLLGKIYLVMLILFLAALCLLNTVDALAKVNILGIVTAGLIALSSVLFIILAVAGEYFPESFFVPYVRISVVIAAITILLDVFVGNFVAMGKRFLVIQIIDYVALAIIEVVLTLAIFGVKIGAFIWTAFGVVAVAFIVLWIVLRILARVKRSSEQAVAKSELETLKAENERLKKLLDENGIQY